MTDKSPLDDVRRDADQDVKKLDELIQRLDQEKKNLEGKPSSESQSLPEDFNEGPHLPGLG